MSFRVANECAERKFGSAARKQIIMFLADKASDDGSGIWCSKGTIQRHTELGESTVKRTVTDFLKEGILFETGRRKCKNGYTVVYCISLSQVAQLESTIEPECETGSTVTPVHSEPPTGSTVNPEPRPPRTPNHPITILKPLTREAEEDLEAKTILVAYPQDRLRGETTCLNKIKDALDGGARSEDLLGAVKAYAVESASYTRSKVSYSDNWFQAQKWKVHSEKLHAEREKSAVSQEAHHKRLACWISDRHPMCARITQTQVSALLASKLVTQEQIRAAGLAK